MPKFRIAQKATFTVEVAIPQVGGKPIKVPFTFKHRDREQMAALYDDWNARAEALRERFKNQEPSLAEVTSAEIENGVAQIKDLVTGWGFEDEFSDESIADLVRSCMGVSDAIVQGYGDAYTKARLGN